jgi:uncharacterized glyoxalase superfamily protein PhnB
MGNSPRTRVFPVLRYDNGPGAVDWLDRAFGFERQNIFTAPDGSIAHGELRLGAGVTGVSSAGPRDGANPWTGVRQGVYVRVPDPDSHHARASAAGADIATPLRDMDYGSREYSARDLGGLLWSFGTYDMAQADGAPNIYAGLRYADAAAAVTWLSCAFGFAPGLQVPGPDGSVMHAEITYRDDTMMADAGGDDAAWNGHHHAVYVAVDDPDAHHRRAAAAGATILQPPTDTPFGARAYYARDPEGFIWGFSTYRPSRR